TECIACPPGTFAANPGYDYCLSCYDDQYQPSSGATGCLDCAAGEHSFYPNATRCFTCGSLLGGLQLVTSAPEPLFSMRHLRLSADLLLPPPGLAGFDPAIDDLSIIALPGLYAQLAANSAWWSSNARRTTWRYTDPTHRFIATLTDRSRKTPGRIHL